MPKDFMRCVNNNGKVRTVSGENKLYGLKKGQYVHICFLKGKMFKGEIKTKEK